MSSNKLQKIFDSGLAVSLPESKTHRHRMEIASETSSRVYVVSQCKSGKNEGQWQCSCPGWIRHRKCKHLTAMLPVLSQITAKAAPKQIEARPAAPKKVVKKKAAPKKVKKKAATTKKRANIFFKQPPLDPDIDIDLCLVENSDLTTAGVIEKMKIWNDRNGGVERYVYDNARRLLKRRGSAMPAGIKRGEPWEDKEKRRGSPKKKAPATKKRAAVSAPLESPRDYPLDKKIRSKHYWAGVEWIADNDEYLPLEELMHIISVTMLADIFEINPITVAEHVLAKREN